MSTAQQFKVKSFQNYQKELNNKISKIKNNQTNAVTNNKNKVNNQNEIHNKKQTIKNYQEKSLQQKGKNSKSKEMIKLTIFNDQSSPKPLSPNRHRNCLHSPVQSVSYGQLQVILRTIDSIKQKAKQQIQTLQSKNLQLTNQLQSLNQKYKNMIILQQQLTSQRQQRQKKSQTLQQQSQSLKMSLQIKQRIWVQQKKQYIQQIINYKQTIRITEQRLQQLQSHLHQQKTHKRQWHSKYQSIVNKLTSNNPQRISQIMYQIGEKYDDESVLEIWESYEKNLIRMKKENDETELERRNLFNGLKEEKVRNEKMNEIIDRLMEDNSRLLLKIQNKEIENKSQLKQLTQTLAHQRSLNSSIKEQLQRLILQTQLKQKQITKLQAAYQQLGSAKQKQIKSLHGQIDQLQHKINKLKQNLSTEDMNKRYFDVVDEQCEDLQDLNKVLGKLELLEKCKIQNRTNVEKIQFLCKMLDY